VGWFEAYAEVWSHHYIACIIITAVVIGVIFGLAGSAGILPGGLGAIIGYGAMAIALAQAGIAVYGGIAFGGGGGGAAAPPTTARADADLPRFIRFSRLDDGSLRAEIARASGMVHTETWTRENVDARIRSLELDTAQEEVRLVVEFRDVQMQLADWVVERIRTDRVEVVRRAAE
jgi:hypothetical protein